MRRILTCLRALESVSRRFAAHDIVAFENDQPRVSHGRQLQTNCLGRPGDARTAPVQLSPTDPGRTAAVSQARPRLDNALCQRTSLPEPGALANSCHDPAEPALTGRVP